MYFTALNRFSLIISLNEDDFKIAKKKLTKNILYDKLYRRTFELNGSSELVNLK